MPGGIQEWIHSLEEGRGATVLKRIVFLLGALALTVWFNLREYRNFSTAESMDIAQVARNLSQGEGFTTDYIRPFSIALLQRHKGEGVNVLNGPHPDLANAPVYPALLAAVLKVSPLASETTADARYKPEIAITIFNQLLLAALIVTMFFLARGLFDDSVAWATAILLMGNIFLWDLSNSATPVLLMLLLFAWIAICLLVMEKRATETPDAPRGLIGLATAVGLLVGVGCLTRYSFGWILIPVLGFIAILLPLKRGPMLAIVVLAFSVVVGPWVARNLAVSGTPFGIAGYAIIENTLDYPENRLERSLPRDFDQDLKSLQMRDYVRKLVQGAGTIFERGISSAAGTWAAALFLTALLIPFRNTSLQRLKFFLLACAVVLIGVQALGTTELSDNAQGITSENLILLLMPPVIMFGAGIFFMLLDQIDLAGLHWRRLLVTTFIVVGSASLIFRLLPPRSYHIQPPYYADFLETIGGMMEPDELMMSDMPWALAWYGQRRCVLTTMDAGMSKPSDFFYINDFQKTIQGLYLSRLTMDRKFVSGIIKSTDGAWSRFVLDALLKTNVPSGFPLKHSPRRMMPEHLFLSDRERWGK